jgi:hypothetical protein
MSTCVLADGRDLPTYASGKSAAPVWWGFLSSATD